jgi:hypothetical protein
MLFSIAHGVVLRDDFDDHCSLQEYVTEFSHPIEHHDEHKGDLCESHFMFHLSFLLPELVLLLPNRSIESQIVYELHLNDAYYQKNTFRPPITL